MTDIVDELKQIKSILNVLYSKVERLEGQVAYCVDALIDLNEYYDDEPLTQHDMKEFDDNDDDDNEVQPPPYASISSSTTKDV